MKIPVLRNYRKALAFFDLTRAAVLAKFSLRSIAVLLCLGATAWAQGTVKIGFEEFKLNDLPPFVVGTASVQDSTSTRFPPFEGQKLLVGVGTIFLQSPDGQPIESVSLHLFLPRMFSPPVPEQWYLVIGDKSYQSSTVEEWQTIQRTLNAPAQSVQISGLYGSEVQPGAFGIDNVEFTTVPEPQTFSLLTIGLTAIASRALLKRPKPTRA